MLRVPPGSDAGKVDERVDGLSSHPPLPLRVAYDVEAGLGTLGRHRAARSEGGVDGHHLRVHGERLVDKVAAAERLANELKCRDARHVGLVLRQAGGPGGAGAVLDAAGLEGAAVVAGAVVIEALADDLTSLDDDAAVTVAKGGESRLLQTKIHVPVSLHCGVLQ